MTIAELHQTDTREMRALALAEQHLEEIAESQRHDGRYTVPSLHGPHTYTVTYTDHTESCDCLDWQVRGATCYHVLAVAVVKTKTHRRVATTQEHPHACRSGYVYLGYTGDEGEEVVEALPCRRCTEVE